MNKLIKVHYENTNHPTVIGNEYINNIKKSNTISEQSITIQEQQSKVEYHDEILNKDELMNIFLIDKNLGTISKELKKIFHDNRVIFKQNSGWLVYFEYSWLIDENYTDYKSDNNDT